MPLVVAPGASVPPAKIRRYLHDTLPPDGLFDNEYAGEQWLRHWCLGLGQLDRRTLAEVDHLLGLGNEKQALAASTAARYRKIARSCIRRAVDLEVLPADPWPPASRGRSQRKAVRQRRTVDIRLLPDPATFSLALDAIVTHQPGSRTYKVMTAVAYYAGLRPSEVVMLRPRALTLPTTGWGLIEVTEADVSYDEPGEPKTGERIVPIPPQLVVVMQEWIDEHELSPDSLMFRTRNDKRPTQSNWGRAWHRALKSVGHEPLRVYDCRHAAATTWLRAGVPLGEVARRLGHSVETLVSTYVGALQGDEQIANERIEAALSATRDR